MIHEIGFDRPGFIDARLQVQQPIELGSAGLTKYLRRCLLEGPGGARLGESLATELLADASTCGDDLAEWERRICLVHGDFNGSNILVRPGPRDSWEVAAVLDWEFAFSGAPAFDFGNLLRAPLGNHPVFETTVAETYRASGGRLPSNWRALSRIADLYAWADFVSRPAVDPSLVADARRVIQATLSKAG